MEAVMFGQDKPEPVQAYSGPGVWVRIASHFGPRLSEWEGSFHMLLLGVVFLVQPDLFTIPEFMYFRAVFGTQILPGAALTVFGFLGLIGLTVNGLRREITPWIRFARAMVGFMLFTGMTTCFALSGVFSTWFAWYTVAAVVELVNMFRTSKDAGESYGSP